ncbi:exonuclease SbcC [Gillisia sp. Hel_I_86]|uniref:AAA family ATPase n=1 Tax=Gillisia sp. Hel_I_86 TaxID=1249981 RepID=UPI0011991314|nr:AAA family ATPase [Gillisia sp. Hel_I_86]TVZ28608.1 exonuclease SbcC [Gillisia sp. Hel_I_86]
MKILKIEFKNINSLRGSHEIDFTASPFTASSLFAITGPTGSGKSSILDVISIALFNQVPRIPGGRTISKNDILKFGAILTRNQKDAMAKVTYHCNSGMFSSKWSINTNRNDKLRDHEMEIIDLSSGNLLDLKKSDVPAKNEELIGLSYDQFIKAVLLAQGEFAQFLKVNKKERGALLEKITGTGIYRKLGMKAYEKYGLLNKEIEKQQHEIQLLEERLLSDEKKLELSAETKFQEDKITELNKTIDDLSKNMELKNVISNQHKEIAIISERQEDETKALKEFSDEFGLQLQQHEKVQFVAEDLRNWSSHLQISSDLKQEAEKFTQDIDKNSSSREHIRLQLEKLIKEPVTQSTFEGQLESFSAKVLSLQEERKEKKRDWDLLNQSLNSVLRPLNFIPEKDPDLNLAKLQTIKAASAKNIQDLKLRLREIDFTAIGQESRKLKLELEQSRFAEKQHDKIQTSKTELDKIIAEKNTITPLLDKLPKQIKGLEQVLQRDNATFVNLNLEKENQLLRASLTELRAKLSENEPCPLCGSLEHPFAAHLPTKTSDLGPKIHELHKKITANTKELATLKANLVNHQTNYDTLNIKEKELTAELENLSEKFKEQFQNLKLKEGISWEQKVQDLEEKLELLEQFEKEHTTLNATGEAIPIIEKLKNVVEKGQAIASKLSSIYKGTDITKDSKDLQSSFTRLQQEQQYLKDQNNKLTYKAAKNQGSIIQIEQKLAVPIQKRGFKTIAEARAALLPDHDYLKIRNKQEALKTEIEKSLTSIKLLKDQLSENLKKDTEKPLEDLKEGLSLNQENLKEIQALYRESTRLLKNHQENLVAQNQLKTSIEEREKQTLRWRLLNTIIGDRTGNKFNEFAQDLTLSQLLQLANVRLSDLSDRYLIDKPTEDEDDGLVAIDEHMGGQRRSVKTLSGGETFILSLSLALALSDLASKNVEINSLFIDEGFGTLDPETLDQTLDTLEKLQAESSKTIGIISHVDSLKERIATQIKLTRNGQGYSSLEVVG